MAAAESPDGAVFIGPEDPASPSPTVAWVVDGNGPAAVAEHVATGIAVLAADSANFYVATYGHVFAFDRASGNPVGQWTMPPVATANTSSDDLVSMAAAGGSVVVSVTQGNTVGVYRITPTSSAAPRLVVRGLGDAVGPDGSVYYERSDFHLAVVRPDGTVRIGPALTHSPTSLGGGVQYVDTVAGGAVWVSEPAGQGLDDRFTTYDTATLAVVGSFAGMVGTTFADSAGGPLALVTAGFAAGCPTSPSGVPVSCVFRIDADGTLSDPSGVGGAVTLLGPGPAVVTSDTGTGQFDLLRLS